MKKPEIHLEKWMIEILKRENHHNHEIVLGGGENPTPRWKPNPEVRDYFARFSLNDTIELLYHLGYDKNSEVYRKLYRDLGYSLYGYWEVFYWEMNNPEASKYRSGLKGFIKRLFRI